MKRDKKLEKYLKDKRRREGKGGRRRLREKVSPSVVHCTQRKEVN